ncbi:plasmid mobilization protein [Streptomyces sp. NPDC048197]|uniref:plasmid mobilization protein n=1 Tax=Streptomyces sp. NPDC048197 TaxID=3365511 RepID=UPI00371E8EC4
MRQRPREPKLREHQPSCRMNPAEYSLLKTAAKRCQMTVAGFLAHCALKAARDLDRTAADIATEREIVEELFAARRYLGRIGGLLNQVAKALNSGADAPQLDQILDAVTRAARRTEAAADTVSRHHDGKAAA